MNDFKVYYADFDLTEYLSVTGLDRGVLPTSEQNLKKIGSADGNRLISSTYGTRTIKMSFVLRYDLIEKRRELARILNKKEELSLIFSDEPDKEWFAIPQGDIGVDEANFLGKGTINWLIPDGVAHAVNPKIYSNTPEGTKGENLILDPEFIKKNKYWKPWVQMLNEQHEGSNILRGNFTNPTFADDSSEKKDHWFQRNESSTRKVQKIKKGDAVSLAIDIRIIEPMTNDTDGSSTAALILEEWDRIGGEILVRHTTRPKSLKIGEWQKLTIENVKIADDRTRAINLAVGVYGDATLDISKPQLNIGSSILPYAVKDINLSKVVEITNKGSYKAHPIIRARMNGENGLVAFVKNNGGILQFGNPEEADIIEGVRSDKVIHYAFRGSQAELKLNDGGVTTYPNYLGNPATPNLVKGRLDWDKDHEAVTPYFINGNVKVWGGPMLSGFIPKNSSNSNTGDFVLKNRFTFNTNVTKRGRLEFVLQNNQDVSFAMVIRDSSATTDELIVECWFKGKNLKSITLDRKIFKFSFWEAQITRTGTKIEFKISGIDQLKGENVIATKYKTFVVDMTDQANIPVTGLTTWFQRFGNTNHVLMSWTDCKFTWVNTRTYRNIPNLFDDGDLLEIDVKRREVSVNGVINNQLHALGNNWEMFVIEKESEIIQPVCSSWANMFETEVELREAFL